MSEKLNFSELRKANVARLEETPKFQQCITWCSSQWLQALVGEVGELANEMKKRDRGDYTILQAQSKFEKEIADVQIYLDLLAHKMNINLADATRNKFNEVSARVNSNIFISSDNKMNRIE